jgi:LPXTG-motif cell wall-anchored protein
MKKLALVLLVMGVMVLGFGLLTASAQDTSANTTVTVTTTDDNLTMSPTTLPVSVPVTFNFTNNGTEEYVFVIEKEGADNEPLEFNGETATFDDITAGDVFSTTWTFEEAGQYQLAAYDNDVLVENLVATFTVGAAGSAQAAATATATTAATSAATSTVTNTATVTATTAATTTTSGTSALTPSNLPTTGGETTNWAAMLLAFGVAALLLGGALTFARRAR